MKISLIFIILLVQFKAQEPSLENLLTTLNTRSLEIAAIIPNSYNFAQGEEGIQIEDKNLFQFGNILSTNHRSNIPYSNEVIKDSTAFGVDSSYFTKKFGGFFILVAENTNANWFRVFNNYGPTNHGSLSSQIFKQDNFIGYNLKVSETEAHNPSINQLIIVKQDDGIKRKLDDETESGYIQINGLKDQKRIYYLFFTSVHDLTREDIQNVFTKFVQIIYSVVDSEKIPDDPSLEKFKDYLNKNYKRITSLVPNIFDFPEGENGNIIEGSPILDRGNLLSTNHEENFEYSNDEIKQSTIFGPNSAYFTRKLPGLFVMAALNTDAQWFRINSNYKTDGQGYSAVRTFTYKNYVCYNLKIFGTTNPSVNKLIILKYSQSIKRSQNGSTDEGYLQANNLFYTSRIYYFLFSTKQGQEVTDQQTQTIFEAAVNLIEESKIPPKRQKNSDACILLFSQCYFEGDSMEICGNHPTISQDLKSFHVSSVRVPEGIQVTFYSKKEFQEEKLKTREHLECLDIPFNLSFLKIEQNLRKNEFVRISDSIKVMKIE